MWIKWATIEEENGNLGSYEIPHSASWIYKEACIQSQIGNESIWVSWANYVARNKSILPVLSDDPLLAMLKEKCFAGTSTVYPWLAWAIIEEARGNIGDYSKEYSAAWLYKESCTNHNSGQEHGCLSKWAQFAYKYPLVNGFGELITAEYVYEYAQKTCPGFNNPLWIDLTNFKKEIGYQ